MSSDTPTPTTRPINPGFDGMDAKARGEPVDVCPYPPGPARTAWVTGWYISEVRKAEDDVKSTKR